MRRYTRTLVVGVAVALATGCGDSTGPGAPMSLEIVSGDEQEALIFDGSFDDPLRIRVLDAAGRAIPGVTVWWAASGGTVSPTETVTDASGMASTEWTFGTSFRRGANTATAAVHGLGPVTFTGYGRIGVELHDVRITPDSVDVGSGPAEVVFTVHLTNDFGVATGANVDFRSPSSGDVADEDQVVTAGPFALVEGTAEDGEWAATLQFPQGAEPGVWTIGHLRWFGTLTTGSTQLIGTNGASVAAWGLPNSVMVAGEP